MFNEKGRTITAYYGLSYEPCVELRLCCMIQSRFSELECVTAGACVREP